MALRWIIANYVGNPNQGVERKTMNSLTSLAAFEYPTLTRAEEELLHCGISGVPKPGEDDKDNQHDSIDADRSEEEHSGCSDWKMDVGERGQRTALTLISPRYAQQTKPTPDRPSS